MHGYEMIQEISERSGGLWRPAPGRSTRPCSCSSTRASSSATKAKAASELFELTEEGRAAAEKVETPPWEEIAEGVDPGQVNLRTAVGQLMGAVAQSTYTATEEQQQRIVDIVNDARREIYSILGESK
jgi:DNA-binding PadR family transcriptional regulator